MATAKHARARIVRRIGALAPRSPAASCMAGDRFSRIVFLRSDAAAPATFLSQGTVCGKPDVQDFNSPRFGLK